MASILQILEGMSADGLKPNDYSIIMALQVWVHRGAGSLMLTFMGANQGASTRRYRGGCGQQAVLTWIGCVGAADKVCTLTCGLSP
jgi:hypothetical protein